jgi:hypothetical protein
MRSGRAVNTGAPRSRAAHWPVRNDGNAGRPVTSAPSIEIVGSWPTTATARPRAGQGVDHHPRVAAGRQAGLDLDEAEEVEAGGDQLGGLDRARQRRGDDGVELDPLLAQEARQTAGGLAPTRRQPARGVAAGDVLGHRVGVPDQVEQQAPRASRGGRALSTRRPTVTAPG